MSDYQPGAAYQPSTPEIRDGAPATVDEQPAEPAHGLAEPPRRGTRNLAPLVWIVLLVLAALVAFAISQARGRMRTPTGGEMPMATPLEPPVMPRSETPVTPADPATGAQAGDRRVDGGTIPVPPETNRG